jgi:hypothetical protein
MVSASTSSVHGCSISSSAEFEAKIPIGQVKVLNMENGKTEKRIRLVVESMLFEEEDEESESEEGEEEEWEEEE